MCSSIHEKTMEMQARTLIPELIVDINDNTIPHGCSDGRQGPMAVNANSRTIGGSIGIPTDPGYIKIIR